jgi:hypothetical protein
MICEDSDSAWTNYAIKNSKDRGKLYPCDRLPVFKIVLKIIALLGKNLLFVPCFRIDIHHFIGGA